MEHSMEHRIEHSMEHSMEDSTPPERVQLAALELDAVVALEQLQLARVAHLAEDHTVHLFLFHISAIDDGVSTERVWTCRYSK